MAALARKCKETAAFWGTECSTSPLQIVPRFPQLSIFRNQWITPADGDHIHRHLILLLFFLEVPEDPWCLLHARSTCMEFVVWFQKATPCLWARKQRGSKICFWNCPAPEGKTKTLFGAASNPPWEWLNNNFLQTRWQCDALKANCYLFIFPLLHHSSRGSGQQEQEAERSAFSPSLPGRPVQRQYGFRCGIPAQGSRLGPAEPYFIVGICTARPCGESWSIPEPKNMITTSSYLEEKHCVWPQSPRTRGLVMGLPICVTLNKWPSLWTGASHLLGGRQYLPYWHMGPWRSSKWVPAKVCLHF